MKLIIHEELCCEICNEIIHNHFNCPACNSRGAATDAYHLLEEGHDKEITCEECGTTFVKLSGNWYDGTGDFAIVK